MLERSNNSPAAAAYRVEEATSSPGPVTSAWASSPAQLRVTITAPPLQLSSAATALRTLPTHVHRNSLLPRYSLRYRVKLLEKKRSKIYRRSDFLDQQSNAAGYDKYSIKDKLWQIKDDLTKATNKDLTALNEDLNFLNGTITELNPSIPIRIGCCTYTQDEKFFIKCALVLLAISSPAIYFSVHH